jgi:xanthine dehydrogenase accessory factor
MRFDRPVVLVRGGGDLATGVTARLHRSGFAVVVTEIAQPLAIRRLVALAEAVYAGEVRVEELVGRRVDSIESVFQRLAEGVIPVLVDPPAQCRRPLEPVAVVDARMRKAGNDLPGGSAPVLIGLGPGFRAGEDCDAVVETKRGHHLGRVLTRGQAEADTGVPEAVDGKGTERVLRAPKAGLVHGERRLGEVVEAGDVIARVDGAAVLAPFRGALRGLLHDGLRVEAAAKIGDLDPRADPTYCWEISDKALAVGGGVLEALLSRPQIRSRLGG